MSKDIKEILYSWLGRNKYSHPIYDTKGENRNGRLRFKCELRVPALHYVAFGNSTNKKDAATNAARDFCEFLVREGHMKAADLPALTSSSLEGSSSWQQSSGSANNSFFENPEEDFLKAEHNPVAPVEQIPSYPWLNAYPRDQGTHQQYLSQKADEIAASESVDMMSQLHGGWTMDNSKKALNECLQKLKLPPIQYVTTIKESNLVKTFEASASVLIPHVQKRVTAQGNGSTKKVAEATCAMRLNRQLFHLNIIQAYSGPTKMSKASTLPEIELNLPADLVQRVTECVQKCGLEIPVIDATEATPDEPQSLLTDVKLAQFPVSEEFPAYSISWAPPFQNWNPWRASNIDEPPLAFMNMEEISAKINEKEAVKQCQELTDKTAKRGELPVSQFKDQIIRTVAENRVTLIKGETGCGKSTQVAQFILDDYIQNSRGAFFNAVVSQPRRISAISLAERVANERGEDVGETVGYSVRFDSVSPRPYGSIMFCTVGVLLRMMENGLRGISHVIIDEIHERDVDTDFVLIVLREMLTVYKDLRIVLMSATIDTNLFTNFFQSVPVIGECPIIEMHGRTHPVQAIFLEDIISNLRFMPEEPALKKGKRGAGQPVDDDEGDEEVDDKGRNMNLITDTNAGETLRLAMSRLSEKEIPYQVIEEILKDITRRGTEGAVLIFLPGWAEIMSLVDRLMEHPEFGQTSKYEVLPLHSQLTSQEQRKVFNHYPGKRKLIVSTNIAETSITIDDVVYVIDSCKAKERMYTSNNNMIHFATVWASKTNVIQRRGRAGRVRAGYAFHLCSKERFEALDEHGTAEMLRIPLHQIALTIKLLRLGKVMDFLGKALEPPPYDMVVESEFVLQSMGALDQNLELTSLGKMLARMPVDPVIARVLILGTALGVGSVMCDVAAAMSFQTPFVPREKHHTRLSGVQRKFAGNKYSDHVALVSVIQRFREQCNTGTYNSAGQVFCERYSLNHPVLKMTEGARRQLIDVLRNQCCFPEEVLYDITVNVNDFDRELDLVRSLLVMALYPNVAYYTGKRNVITIDQSSALINKYSVLVPMNVKQEVEPPSPLLIFTEKVRTRCISCKQLSVITALQLLVFGSRKVECIGKGLVRIDNLITLRMDVQTAVALACLRPCIEALLVKSCENPETLASVNPLDAELSTILRDISSEAFMTSAGPLKDNVLTDQLMTVKGSNAASQSFDYNTSYNSWGSETSSPHSRNIINSPATSNPHFFQARGGKFYAPRGGYNYRGNGPHPYRPQPPPTYGMGYQNFNSGNSGGGDWSDDFSRGGPAYRGGGRGGSRGRGRRGFNAADW